MAKILIIDDDEVQLRLLRVILVEKGFTVNSTADGPQGILLYKTHRPDLVLLDLGLPSMSGIDVVREIRNIDNAAKILIVTGYPSMESTVRSIQSGVIDVVQKPVDVESLLKKITAALHMVGN